MNVKLAPSRWYRLIPVAFITYSLAYLDRANFGFAAAGEMAKDLHITAATSSLFESAAISDCGFVLNEPLAF